MKNKLFVAAALAPMLVFILQGCVVSTKETQISPQITSLFKGEYKIDPYFEKNKPRRVAVLPFVNSSTSQQGSETVRRVLQPLQFAPLHGYEALHRRRPPGQGRNY